MCVACRASAFARGAGPACYCPLSTEVEVSLSADTPRDGADDMACRFRGVWPRGLATGQPGCVRLADVLYFHRDHAAAFASPVRVSRTPVHAALRSCGSGRLQPRLARPVPAARAGLRPGHGRPTGTGARCHHIRRLAVAGDAGPAAASPAQGPADQERSSLTAQAVGVAAGPERHSVRPLSAGDMPRLSLSWTESLGPRPGSVIIATPRNEPLTCNASEPPIGIEPMTYALRGACSPAADPLAATMPRASAQMALTALGFCADPVHEPVHGGGRHI
jgi:hypothetical protein